MSSVNQFFGFRHKANPFPRLRDSETERAEAIPAGTPEAAQAIERVRLAMQSRRAYTPRSFTIRHGDERR